MNIAVSLSVLEKSAYAETCEALSQDWVRFLDDSGITPILVPNTLEDPNKFCSGLQIDGILLTSGNDFGPLPAEDWPGSDSVSDDRDRTESTLVKFAIENSTPIMGICRGMQVINVYFGGSIVRDLQLATGGEKHVAVQHGVKIVDARFKSKIGTDELTINSYHNHGLTTDSLSPELKTIAVSKGGVVEALYHPNLPVIGTQWHPERPNIDKDGGSSLIQEWLKWCQYPCKARTRSAEI